MTNTLFDKINAMLQQKSMLKHPFYQVWNDGQLTREMLKQYACQYYHFVKEFPRMVSAVHSNTPELLIRQELLLNLMDEETGSDNHPALWMRFANALGAGEVEVNDTVPLPTTAGLVDTMMSYCRTGSYQEGMAALYAYEAQVPEVSKVKIEGLKKFYGVTSSAALQFFSVHQEADVYHSRTERDLIEKYTPRELEDAVELASRQTAESLWRFLDGIYGAYVDGRISAS